MLASYLDGLSKEEKAHEAYNLEEEINQLKHDYVLLEDENFKQIGQINTLKATVKRWNVTGTLLFICVVIEFILFCLLYIMY